ncbi:MAG TPA: hypothetical protein VFE23_19940 [Usitatibacter sp.]|jgi:hypothetical protein|nr:hypothetical protein [Usitatibacter sp.]
MMLRLILLTALAVLVTVPAFAIDDRFDPKKYDKGGFAPITDDTYAKECGSCHFTYLPGMLPERSWHALMAQADKHFGEALGLAPDVKSHIEGYLATNAADRSPYRGSELMLWELPASATPLRVTALPLMRHRHVVMRKLMEQVNVPLKNFTNCEVCHENASSGSFAYDRIVVPGVSKVVRPGGMF